MRLSLLLALAVLGGCDAATTTGDVTDDTLDEVVNVEPYACGWEHGDPGTLTATGKQVGDTIRNLSFKDQCREDVPLWDFAGSYQILFMTATWCGSCITEARELETRTTDFVDRTGIPFHYTIVLFEDDLSQPPKAKDAVDYAETVDVYELPVLSSTDQGILTHTPYGGRTLPGKCILSPDMELLDCTEGHGDDAELFAAIEAHAAK